MFHFPLAAHAVYRGFAGLHRPIVSLFWPLNCRKFTTSAESAQGGLGKKLKKNFGADERAFCRAFCRGKSPLCPCTGRRRASGEPVVRARRRARQNRLRAALRARPRADERLPGHWGRLPGHRHAAKMAAVHRDAAFQWLGRPRGVPLGVGGPPARDCIFWRAVPAAGASRAKRPSACSGHRPAASYFLSLRPRAKSGGKQGNRQ